MRTHLLLATAIALLSNGLSLCAQAQSVPEPLKVPARFGVSHSTSGAGFDGVTGIQGFVPLYQVPGDNLTFIDARLLLDNGGNLGGNFALGYRDYNANRNRIQGGYLGVDIRSTNDSTFYQLGAGFESLGKWDFRFNSYLPIGSTSNTVRDIDLDTGLLTSTAFQSNQLLLNSQRQRQRILVIEDALGGVDLETGGKLVSWKGGDLRGYGGIYVMGGENTDTFLGGKLRLAANLTPNFQAGIGLQHDSEFGTNLAFSIGASFPGVRSKNKTETVEETPLRLQESLARNPNIVVATQSQSEIRFENNTQALQNPEEEQDYQFIHVALGSSGGDGSAERPFGSVDEAIALASSNPDLYSDGNTVIYVDGEQGGPISSFTIPERVQVLSQGPEQYLAGLPFPGFPAAAVRLPFSRSNDYTDGIRVQLPFSGDGVFPVITGGADLVTAGGDRTVLAGFQLQNAGQNAFVANGVTDVELRNNRITGAGANGIFLDDVGGSVTLFDNEIIGSAARGLYVENRTTLQSVDVAIAGYQLDDNGIGMEFAALGTPGQVPSQIISILPSDPATNTSQNLVAGGLINNSILNSDQAGLLIRSEGTALNTATNQEVAFSQGTIAGSGAVGLQVIADRGAGVQEVRVETSTIRQNAGAGIEVRNGTATPNATAYAQEIFVRGSAITGNGAAGIDIALNSAGAQEITLDNNQITNNQGDGIRSVAAVAGLQEWPTNASTNGAGISNNIISGNGGQGINIAVRDAATIPVLNLLNNKLENNQPGTVDIDIVALSPSVTACVIASGNTANGIRLSTFSLDADNQATFFVRSRDLLTSLNNGAPAQLINSVTAASEPSAFIDVNNACIP